MNERDSSIDFIKGVCVLLIVLGHCQVSISLHDLLFFFHVPLFFIISGYNYRKRVFVSELSVSCRRLLLPYLFVASVLFAIEIVRTCMGEGGMGALDKILALIWGSGFPYHFCLLPFSKADSIGPLWFLWAMFWARLFMNCIMHLENDNLKIGLVCMIAIIFVNIKQYFSLPFSLIPGICATGFLYCGYLLKKYDFLNHERGNFFLLICLFIFVLCLIPSGNLDVNLSQYKGYYILDLFGEIAVFGIAIIVSRKLLFNNRFAFVIEKIGRYSLSVYCVHALEYNLMYSYWPIIWMKYFPIDYAFVLEIILRVAIALLGSAIILKVPFLKKYIFSIKN